MIIEMYCRTNNINCDKVTNLMTSEMKFYFVVAPQNNKLCVRKISQSKRSIIFKNSILNTVDANDGVKKNRRFYHSSIENGATDELPLNSVR